MKMHDRGVAGVVPWPPACAVRIAPASVSPAKPAVPSRRKSRRRILPRRLLVDPRVIMPSSILRRRRGLGKHHPPESRNFASPAVVRKSTIVGIAKNKPPTACHSCLSVAWADEPSMMDSEFSVRRRRRRAAGLVQSNSNNGLIRRPGYAAGGNFLRLYQEILYGHHFRRNGALGCFVQIADSTCRATPETVVVRSVVETAADRDGLAGGHRDRGRAGLQKRTDFRRRELDRGARDHANAGRR